MTFKDRDSDKYYVGIFYFDHTTKKLFVYEPDANRYTLNYANKWAYFITAIIILFFILGTIARISDRHK